MRTKRFVHALVATLFALAATGCFVFDEIDNAGTFEKPGAKAGAKAAAAPKPGSAPANAAAKPAAPSGDAWWKTASSLTSEAGDDSITSCAIDGRTEFTKRDECISRGGVPK